MSGFSRPNRAEFPCERPLITPRKWLADRQYDAQSFEAVQFNHSSTIRTEMDLVRKPRSLKPHRWGV